MSYDSDRYYGSVFGGWVCRDCGSLVHERDTHDEWHEGIVILTIPEEFRGEII